MRFSTVRKNVPVGRARAFVRRQHVQIARNRRDTCDRDFCFCAFKIVSRPRSLLYERPKRISRIQYTLKRQLRDYLYFRGFKTHRKLEFDSNEIKKILLAARVPVKIHLQTYTTDYDVLL